MAIQNINVLDVLAQVEHEQNAILENIREINDPELLKDIGQSESEELQQMLHQISVQSAEFLTHLTEVHGAVTKNQIFKDRGSTK